MYLSEGNKAPALELIRSPLWADIKRCLEARRPEAPDAGDKLRTQAAKGMKRAGFEKAVEEIEKLPFEIETKPADPFDRPALNPED